MRALRQREPTTERSRSCHCQESQRIGKSSPRSSPPGRKAPTSGIRTQGELHAAWGASGACLRLGGATINKAVPEPEYKTREFNKKAQILRQNSLAQRWARGTIGILPPSRAPQGEGRAAASVWKPRTPRAPASTREDSHSAAAAFAAHAMSAPRDKGACTPALALAP